MGTRPTETNAAIHGTNYVVYKDTVRHAEELLIHRYGTDDDTEASTRQSRQGYGKDRNAPSWYGANMGLVKNLYRLGQSSIQSKNTEFSGKSVGKMGGQTN